MGVLWWCRQANDRGLLQGDVNRIRAMAKDACFRMDIARERRKDDVKTARLESLIDMWMAIEHNQIYEEKQRKKSYEAENRDSNQVNLLAPDMAGILEMLRRDAELESEASTE